MKSFVANCWKRTVALEPRPSGCKKLVGKQFDNLYRIRVGDWRILYAIEDDRLVVLILDVVRRDQAYRAR
jgi:mRNA interferase RelE/StbE